MARRTRLARLFVGRDGVARESPTANARTMGGRSSSRLSARRVLDHRSARLRRAGGATRVGAHGLPARDRFPPAPSAQGPAGPARALDNAHRAWQHAGRPYEMQQRAL